MYVCRYIVHQVKWGDTILTGATNMLPFIRSHLTCIATTNQGRGCCVCCAVEESRITRYFGIVTRYSPKAFLFTLMSSSQTFKSVAEKLEALEAALLNISRKHMQHAPTFEYFVWFNFLFYELACLAYLSYIFRKT